MDWRNECISFINQPDLLEQNRKIATKIATADGITRYMISRMKTIFKGGVSEKWLPLGSRGVHKFSLLFACANPSPKARELAQRVAKEIMTSN